MGLKNYNCPVVLGSHRPENCSVKNGGNDAVAVILDDTAITDFTNTTQWNDAIADGTVVLIEKIRGEFPEPSEVKGENIRGCGPSESLDGFDFTFTFQDANVNGDNDDFYGNLNLLTFCFVWWNCQEDEIRIVEQDVRSVAKPANSPASNKEKQMYTVVFEWSGDPDDFPELSDAPAGIFST